jgi:Tol biopolymer transport system component
VKRSFALAATVVLVTALLSTGELFAFGKNKIAYDKFDWQVYRSTHFDVYFYEEGRPALQKVVNYAESAYDDLSRKFNFQITKRIPLIYYTTHSAFEQTNVTLTFIPEGVGAFAEPVKNRMVMPIDMPDEKLYKLIAHELTHIFEFEILFQGKLNRGISANPPIWLMEGLASFMAQDEDTRDRMVLRDAVINDLLPSIDRNFGGYFAYRFGHAVFAFIVDQWDWDGLRDFIFEYRNTLGASVERPLKRSLDISVEEFNTRFRTWLRQRYLPALITKGEPTEYGEVFRVTERPTHEISGVASPSGDLLAVLTTNREHVNVAIMNVPERKLQRQLTGGYPDRYEFIIAQALSTGPVMGRDIAFSPDGDRLAMFAKRERGRSLVLMNALTGHIERMIPMSVEQPLNPAFSPDGRLIAFHGFTGSQADIYIYDLETSEVTNLTNDTHFNASPVFSPDGSAIIYSSITDGYSKLFRLDMNEPTQRTQLTTGAWNDIDATFSPDGRRIFYASDRLTGRDHLGTIKEIQRERQRARAREDEPVVAQTELSDADRFLAYNVYSLNLDSGDILQYTDVVGGAFTPSVFIGTGNRERMTFASYYKGRWQLFTTTTDKGLPIEKVDFADEALISPEWREFLAPVEVEIDGDRIERAGGFRLFLEDIDVSAGVNSDQTFLSRSVIHMSDLLGGRRFIASLDSVSTFSNFDLLYFDLRNRLNWGVRVFDDRTYFTALDQERGGLERVRRLYHQTGALGMISYPFDRFRRVEVGAGYMMRDIDYPFIRFNPDGSQELDFISRKDDFPIVTTAFSGDSTNFKSFGPITGRRYRLGANYAHDSSGGALTTDFTVDFRQYFQVTSRSLLAARIFGGYSDGNSPSFYYFGGLNTLRGYDFRSFIGDRAFYGNFEYRFPVVDLIATPVLALREIRGVVFLDVGAAYFDGEPFSFAGGSRLQDGRGSVGYGVSMRLFGLELHWDFARRTDLRTIEPETRTSFWIGQSF